MNMPNRMKYDSVFKNSILVSQEQLNENLTYESVPSWDSIGHMSLIAGLENEFSIALDIDDVIDFSSYTQGIKILEKYGIEI
jgi:acyl carrier protein